jgi:menaquinone-dependent protoporphyrinogen oxidase
VDPEWRFLTMKILVTAASKHGATAEMAGWIGETLGDAGLDVEVRAPDDVTSLDGFDAVVLGSGVYAGKWLGAATKLVDRLGPQFQARQVWLFSSGPAGDPPKPEADPVDAEPMRVATSAREHRVFAGQIDRSKLGFAEWAIVAALRVPNGDYRQRPEVEAWAREIATALTPAPTSVG